MAGGLDVEYASLIADKLVWTHAMRGRDVDGMVGQWPRGWLGWRRGNWQERARALIASYLNTIAWREGQIEKVNRKQRVGPSFANRPRSHLSLSRRSSIQPLPHEPSLSTSATRPSRWIAGLLWPPLASGPRAACTLPPAAPPCLSLSHCPSCPLSLLPPLAR